MIGACGAQTGGWLRKYALPARYEEGRGLTLWLRHLAVPAKRCGLKAVAGSVRSSTFTTLLRSKELSVDRCLNARSKCDLVVLDGTYQARLPIHSQRL